MVQKSRIRRISDTLWEIPPQAREGMRVPARIYADEDMLDSVLQDRSLEQLVNVATLPGIVEAAMVMPDVHEGYGFPIGGVAAMRYPDGVISPGGIGYDINCGVRLLLSRQDHASLEPRLDTLADALYGRIPSGVGRGGALRLGAAEMDRVLRKGAAWAVARGYGGQADLELTESLGCLEGADPGAVSPEAKGRAADQLGTIGSGNHFVEVDRVDRIFAADAAGAMGLEEGQVAVLIHTGSRGLGHQVATDHLREMARAMVRYGIRPVDRQLACVPFESPEGRAYFGAMAAAANFAWCNRQVVAHEARRAWEEAWQGRGGPLVLLYDVAHNIAKIEEHDVEGSVRKVIVHRKGATRAFGPGHAELPSRYRAVGQPVIIPGSMGTASYVLAGTEGSMTRSLGSSCHGAGRRLARRAARNLVKGPSLREELEARGIRVRAGSLGGLAEEAPMAYKDVESVVDIVHRAGIARKVARLVPMAVIKG